MENKVAVIVPIYKNTFTELEKISLKQCFKVLPHYITICVKPVSLKLDDISKEHHFNKVVSFEDFYFEDIQGYNKLMLSSEFYKAFLQYEFILLYQLDAFIFRDDLRYWCSQRFDYIGAPWLRCNDYPDIVKKVKSKMQTYLHIKLNKRINGAPTDIQFENKVGNGGFSLRRVSKFYHLSMKYKETIDYYNLYSHHHFHEDAFWSIEVNRKRKNLNIPNYQKALSFSFENVPERCLMLNGQKLPTGCHAWDKHLNFWRPIFEKLNYTI